MIELAKPADNLRKLFNPKVIFGAALLEHCFIEVGLGENAKAKDVLSCPEKVTVALEMASKLMKDIATRSMNNGFIITKEEQFKKQESSEQQEKIITFLEFHPILFNQHKNSSKGNSHLEFDTFDKSIDVFFSSIEGQKIDQKALGAERDALKKLDNVRRDHEKRLEALSVVQASDERRASLIEVNNGLVEKALTVMRSAVANQISWQEIEVLLKEAQSQGEQVACSIKGLDLKRNQFVMELSDPYESDQPPERVNIDLDLTAFANARKYYDRKRVAAKKEQKTVESSNKALKSAEHKTKQALKEVAIKTSIVKARRIYWFEKFFWAISSENYLIIAGRDAQQNELIVKRYMKPGDVYVHGDLHGASTVVVKNSQPGQDIPPRTLEEAANMAVCYSTAWEAKIVTRAWWVRPEQVSKTAPSGEYLTVGSFMIRGKKNYLPLSQLILGLGFLFKLDDDSVSNHKDERRIRGGLDDGTSSVTTMSVADDDELEIKVPDDGSDDDELNSAFPDTRIRGISINDESVLATVEEELTAAEILKPMEAKVKKQKVPKKASKGGNVEKPTVPITQSADDNQQVTNKDDQSQGQVKRGQKSKLKKIKKKYKDQDEEERQLYIDMMSSAGSKQKDDKKSKVSSITKFIS